MRHVTTSALAVLVLATLIATAAPNPLRLVGELSAQGRHTYEVLLQNEPAFDLKADRIEHHPSGMVTLVDGDVTVAAFTAYQLVYVVRSSKGADRTYEIKTGDGTVRKFPADRLLFDPNQMVRLMAGDELVGLVWNNNVRYVVATDARP